MLSRAAYEEWYFRKTESLIGKKEEARIRSEKIKERIEIERRNKQELAGQKFQKWLEDKRKQGSAEQVKRLRYVLYNWGKIMKRNCPSKDGTTFTHIVIIVYMH